MMPSIRISALWSTCTLVLLGKESSAFVPLSCTPNNNQASTLSAIANNEFNEPCHDSSRRNILASGLSTLSLLVISPGASIAGTFTPGGTLVDRDVGILVGNPQASPSRKVDNSNVLFSQDNYFKFGVAAPWIEPDSTEFPKTMPFVLSQQRYDALKKYGDRVKAGANAIKGLQSAIEDGTYASIPGRDDSSYALRPFGLLANGFLGSENTGTTNELLLSRWYINEIYLRVDDIKGASGEKEASIALDAAKKGINSYLAMLNRVITSKVGNKFDYV